MLKISIRTKELSTLLKSLILHCFSGTFPSAETSRHIYDISSLYYMPLGLLLACSIALPLAKIKGMKTKANTLFLFYHVIH